MDDWNQHLEFQNFNPNKLQEKNLRKCVEDIVWLSPSDSVVRFKIKKTAALFHVQCRVNSSCGQFIAEGVSKQFSSALKLMEIRFKKEVNRWKQNRSFLYSEVVQQQVS